MKKTELSDIFNKYSLYFANFKVTEAIIRLWFEDFGEIDSAEFELALKSCINEVGRAFFPVPGEVRKHLSEARVPAQFSPQEAWNLALKISYEIANRKNSSVGQIKRYFFDKYDFGTKPALTETFRSHLEKIGNIFYPKACEYNPWGLPGPTIEEVSKSQHWCEQEFKQEYKTRLKDFSEKIKFGIDPYKKPVAIDSCSPDQITLKAKAILTQLELL